MFELFNLRLGKATNSSSTHSLVFLPREARVEDDELDGYSFGWQFFTAASDEAKRAYLAAMLFGSLERQLPVNYARLITGEWTGSGAPSQDAYIDHQSLYVLPCAFGTELPDQEFFNELKDYFMQPGLVVLGGNDNDEESHPLGHGNFTLPIPRDEASSRWTCRKDDGHWVLFNRSNGTKIRFMFSRDPKVMSRPPVKSLSPELIDIKITDFCPFNCKYCYQGSTEDGENAEVEPWSIASALKELKVFEVAMGGGEPTLSPRFADFVSAFARNGVMPNFTTKNLGWLRDNKVWPKIIDQIGAFAFSVDGKTASDQVRELATILDANGIDHNKASVQAVIGPGLIEEQHQLSQLAATAKDEDLRLTLLGYKTTGRGEVFKRKRLKQRPWAEKQPGWWVGVLNKLAREFKCGAVGIDTALAAEGAETLKEIDVPSWLFTTEEGKFSCYIDLVKRQIGPSSYCDEDQMSDLPVVSAEEITKAYARF